MIDTCCRCQKPILEGEGGGRISVAGSGWQYFCHTCYQECTSPITPQQHLVTALDELAIPERFTVEHNTVSPEDFAEALKKENPIFEKDRKALAAKLEQVRENNIHQFRFHLIDHLTQQDRVIESPYFLEAAGKDMALHCAQQLKGIMDEKIEAEQAVVPFALAVREEDESE